MPDTTKFDQVYLVLLDFFFTGDRLYINGFHFALKDFNQGLLNSFKFQRVQQ